MDTKIQAFFFNPPLEASYTGHAFSEIYKEKIYTPYLEGRKDLTILDIGANVGITAHYFSQFAKQVYSLEPATEHFDCLTRMIAFNNLTNVKPIKKALYTEVTKLPLYKNQANTSMFSLFKNVTDGLTPPEVVDTTTLDLLFEEEKIDHVEFMKLDVEGTENEILSSLSFKKVAPKIDTILLEVHGWSGRHPHQIQEALKSNGYVVILPDRTTMINADIVIAKRK